MTRNVLFIAIAIAIFLAGSCIDPYNPPEIASSEPYLIVDGLVDLNSENARVILVHSQGLNAPGDPWRESNATVTITVNGSQTFALPETAPGEYTAVGLPISPGDQCQLRIQTDGGEQCVADTVTSRATPPIAMHTWTAMPDQFEHQ